MVRVHDAMQVVGALARACYKTCVNDCSEDEGRDVEQNDGHGGDGRLWCGRVDRVSC